MLQWLQSMRGIYRPLVSHRPTKTISLLSYIACSYPTAISVCHQNTFRCRPETILPPEKGLMAVGGRSSVVRALVAQASDLG